VSLAEYTSVGSLMGSLSQNFCRGMLASIMYWALHKQRNWRWAV
jgi:hypothetical protein